MAMTQAAKAERLRALHVPSRPLLLVNVWDVVSARIVESLGFAAIATTSAGIAWTEGFADGEQISREHMLSRVARIAAAVGVPVTADLEGGYGESIDDAVATARGAIAAGAVGLNFEDAAKGGEALLDVKAQTARIAAMREAAKSAAIPLVINARTDVFLAGIGDNDAWRLHEAIERSNSYLKAGADCAFVPGVTDEPTIAKLIDGICGPLNVLAGAAIPAYERLAALGVARISLGSGAMAYALAKFKDLAASVHAHDAFEALAQRIPHGELNDLVSHKPDA
jgi:2-methylisocitrate lyase-like PEP mutase family enzyme